MNLLLDTHCLIWALTDAPQLGQQARENGCRLLTIDRTLAEFGARVLRPQ